MDFENTQLLAEVSLAKVPEKFEWNKYSVMQLSDAAYLKSYEVDFLSSDPLRSYFCLNIDNVRRNH